MFPVRAQPQWLCIRWPTLWTVHERLLCGQTQSPGAAAAALPACCSRYAFYEDIASDSQQPQLEKDFNTHTPWAQKTQKRKKACGSF